MSDKHWHIKPTWQLDIKKYKGKGRPKATDYYIDKGENIGTVERDKYGNLVIHINGENIDKLFCSVGE